MLIQVPVAGCSQASPIESEFCVLVSDSSKNVDEVIAMLDTHAAEQGYLRGEESPNGTLYGDKRIMPNFVISVTPVGPRGVEVAFFPREPRTYAVERKALDMFVKDRITQDFDVIACDQAEGYGKGAIYGFDGIKI